MLAPGMSDPADLARFAAAARVAVGLAFVMAPRRLGGLLIGSDADSPGARLFIAAFGARDVLLGAGTLSALRAKRPARWWDGLLRRGGRVRHRRHGPPLRPTAPTPPRPD